MLYYTIPQKKRKIIVHDIYDNIFSFLCVYLLVHMLVIMRLCLMWEGKMESLQTKKKFFFRLGKLS